MRAIINISVPAEKKTQIQERANKAGMTVSAYILNAIAIEQEMISEEDLIKMAKKAEKNYKAGNMKQLTSLTDLLK